MTSEETWLQLVDVTTRSSNNKQVKEEKYDKTYNMFQDTDIQITTDVQQCLEVALDLP